MSNVIRIFIYHIFNYLLYIVWILSRKHTIVPHCVKAERVSQIQNVFQYDTFIETGTYMGDMINAQKKNFLFLHTIEFSHRLAKIAKKRFSNLKNIHVHEGDSADIIFRILRRIHAPSIFWLDAHYSGGITGKNSTNTPILSELHAIFQLSSLPHVILIDDARLFIGKYDYPTIGNIAKLIKKYRKNAHIYIKYDIIHIIS